MFFPHLLRGWSRVFQYSHQGVFVPFQERGLSLYEDQEIKDESVESNTATLRDAISLAVPDETSSGKNVPYHSVHKTT